MSSGSWPDTVSTIKWRDLRMVVHGADDHPTPARGVRYDEKAQATGNHANQSSTYNNGHGSTGAGAVMKMAVCAMMGIAH